MSRKVLLGIGGALVVAVALAAGLLWKREYVLELDQAQLQKSLDAAFPVEKTYLVIIKIDLSDPAVALHESSDRIRFAVSVGVGVPGINGRLRGRAELSGRIRYEPDHGAFYAEEPTVEQLSVHGLPDRYVDKTRGAVAWAVKGVLESRPVYTLKTGDVRQSAARLLLKDVRVSGGKLRLRLGVGP